jgi:hypothetical protein
VPNHSAGVKRNRDERCRDCYSTRPNVLSLFEIALVLVRFDHVATIIVNENDGIM